VQHKDLQIMQAIFSIFCCQIISVKNYNSALAQKKY